MNLHPYSGVPAAYRAGLAAFALAIVASALLLISCGDDDGDDTPLYISRSEDAIREYVPDSDSVILRYLASTANTEEGIDIIMSTTITGSPRMHLVSDPDAIADATQSLIYKDVAIYLKAATYWAELPEKENENEGLQVFAGTPSEEGLRTYLDFYLGNQEGISDERFWNAFDYAAERIPEGLEDQVFLLSVDYEREFQEGLSAIRIFADTPEGDGSVSALYDATGNEAEISEEAVTAFKERFAVPLSAEEVDESPWDYPARVWFRAGPEVTITPPVAFTPTPAPSAGPEATQ